jgi:hypothetical protein
MAVETITSTGMPAISSSFGTQGGVLVGLHSWRERLEGNEQVEVAGRDAGLDLRGRAEQGRARDVVSATCALDCRDVRSH